ncbi:carbohydrate kinase family protein [Candidatus Woesebacteria bacterium]|nr:MAG: carbohydrate kinase family protein [Candidatus Woesebacteria bacterium]
MNKLSIFGSARVDAFMEIPDGKANKKCSLDTKKCVIELSYAAKISMNNVTFLAGGNGANVAIGAKRMGVESALVAELGEGALADYVKEVLSHEITLDYVTQSEGVNQGFGAVIVYQGERTILSYYAPKQPPFPDNLEVSDWAYLTSVGENFEGFYEDVYNWLMSTGAKLAFNPGGRQIAKGKSWLAKYLSRTQVVFSNREEAEKIVGLAESHGKEKELLEKYLALGPTTVVITDGEGGSYAAHNGNFYKVGVIPVTSVERTGAGDAYSTGFLAATINGFGIEDSLLCGTINAASVIGFIGPQQGLLDLTSINERLNKAKESGLNVTQF